MVLVLWFLYLAVCAQQLVDGEQFFKLNFEFSYLKVLFLPAFRGILWIGVILIFKKYLRDSM